MTVDNNKTIVILKSSEDSLQILESFLRTRNWDFFSTSDFKKAIIHAVSNSTKFFLICSDHPFKNLKGLAKMILQATNMNLMVYCDQASTVSIAKLREFECKYELMPPLSGPALSRMINQIQKDELKNQSKSANPASDNKDLLLKSILQIAGVEQSWALIKGEPVSSHSVLAPLPKSELLTSDESSKKDSQNKLLALDLKVNSKQEPNEFAIIKKNINTGLKEAILPGKTYIGRKATQGDSLLSLGLKKILNLTFSEDPEVRITPHKKYSDQNYCVVVEVQRFQGYLVAAFSEKQEINFKLIETIREKLFNFLKSQGEISREEIGALPLKLRAMSFEDWAYDQAEFMQKAFYKTNQITLAYFRCERNLPKFTESVKPNMVKMEIKNVISEVVTAFDIYIYLPENNKFLLYTPKGSIFSEIQKKRLIAKKLIHVHLKMEDKDLARIAFAEDFLSETMKDSLYMAG
jgi:hypothetical protein